MSRTAAFYWVTLVIGVGGLAGCKPPPTDANLTRGVRGPEPVYASDPLPSPDTQGADWVVSPQDEERLIYGVPGAPALVALKCLGDSVPRRLRITRLSPADEGAGALMALVGNGHIGRIAVDALEVSGRRVWEGEALAKDIAFEPLAGPRSLTVTVPGAGMVTINEGEAAMQFLENCRSR